jgi:hypothetical protein
MKRLSMCAGAVALILWVSIASAAQSGDRASQESEIRALVGQLKETEQQYLAPSDKDKAKYAAFLQQPDTGLTRLLPREIFQNKLTINGGGAYYSFARLTHEYGFGSDIELQLNGLMVGFAGADFGFLTRIGKAPLEAVTLDHPAAVYLANFQAPSEEPVAREEYRRSQTGFTENGFTYKQRVPVKKKNTYLLRSINYGGSDLLVAFTVIKVDTDGSVLLLWKILKRFPVPQLDRAASVRTTESKK